MTTSYNPANPLFVAEQEKRCRHEGKLAEAACWGLIFAVEGTGGAISDGDGVSPRACDDWYDLGDTYLSACRAVDHEPLVDEDYEDEDFENALEDLKEE